MMDLLPREDYCGTDYRWLFIRLSNTLTSEFLYLTIDHWKRQYCVSNTESNYKRTFWSDNDRVFLLCQDYNSINFCINFQAASEDFIFIWQSVLDDLDLDWCL